MRLRARLTVACFGLLAACAPAVLQTVPLGDAWPEKVLPYSDEYERWTRRAVDRNELVQTLSVSATLLGAEFRAAFVHERARRLALTADDEARLVDDQKMFLADGWDVELLVATAKPDWNDFVRLGSNKVPGSMWRVVLVGDGGREVAPISVKKDLHHREDIQAYFPDLKLFYEAYVLRFPKAAADGQPLVGEKGQLALKIGGSIGQVTLVWASP